MKGISDLIHHKRVFPILSIEVRISITNFLFCKSIQEQFGPVFTKHMDQIKVCGMQDRIGVKSAYISIQKSNSFELFLH